MSAQSEHNRATLPAPAPPLPEETETEIGNRRYVSVPDRDRPTVSVIGGPAIGAVLPLDDLDEITIGRGHDNVLRVEDPGLSRHHLTLFRSGDALLVSDAGSKNGTFVEGVRIDGAIKLADGMRIQLGRQTVLKFSLQDAIEQAAALQVYEWTVRDPLTAAHNRRYLDDRLQQETAFAARHGTQLSLLLIDIDHFKQLNDTYGHRAGDLVLGVVTRFLQRALRAEDVVARYGGEEFVVLARGIDITGAATLAERIRWGVEQLSIPWEGEELSCTVTIGVGTMQEGASGTEPAGLVGAADQALYRAKNEGRNRVCVSEDGT